MDWEHFRRALCHDQPESVRLSRLIDEIPFIKDFLSSLINKLRDCQTHEDCNQKYPQAGSLLNLASMHPFIAADKQLARLLVACLLEYSKIQYGDTSASLQYQSKSVSWCIIRIRHMVNVSRHQNRDDSVIEKRIQELITKLNDDISHQRLSADKVCDFLDRSLLLIDAKLGPALITRLITASIKIRGNGPVVSPRFLQRLVGSSTANDVWAIYKSWPDDIKLELWKSHPEILRVELLNHLDLQKENNKPKDLDSLYGSLVKVLGRDRQVCQHAFKIIADALLKFENWRVFRVGWYLVRELLQGMSQIVPDGLDLLANLLENDTEVFPYPDIRVALQDYVYGGSYHDMALRRIYAWFLIMLHPSYIYKCTHSLVKWSLCDKGKTWDQDLEEAAAYLSWVISPSDDDRMTESHDRLHAWLTALKAHVSGIDNDTLPFKSLLCTLYDDVSCGNVLVTLCMAVAVLSCIPFDRVGHIELLESVLLEYNAPHRVRCNSSSSTDMKVPSSLPKEFHQPALYIFLDLLPLWQQIFGDHSAILETLIQHVNTLISS